MSYSTNEKALHKKNKESNSERAEVFIQKGQNTAIINREKGNSALAHLDQIRLQGEYEEQNETVPSVNDLLEQPFQDETSKDEIMRDEVDQNEFENSAEDQIMQEDDLDYSSVRDRSRSSREKNTGERQREQSNPENKTITRSTRSTKGTRPTRFREILTN